MIVCQTWMHAAALVGPSVRAHEISRRLGDSWGASVQDEPAGVPGLVRSAFCPATRVVRQWVKECQQPEGGESSKVSCFVHVMTQLGGPTLPQPRACTCAGF